MAAADDDQTGGSQRPPSKRPPTHGNPDADPVLVHRRYVEQRLWSGNPERDDTDREDAEGGDNEGESNEADGTDPSMRSAEDEGPDQGLEDLARERYDRALDQWHQLPGAVSRPPTEVTAADAADPGGDEASDDASDDTDESSQ